MCIIEWFGFRRAKSNEEWKGEKLPLFRGKEKVPLQAECDMNMRNVKS